MPSVIVEFEFQLYKVSYGDGFYTSSFTQEQVQIVLDKRFFFSLVHVECRGSESIFGAK